MKVRIWHGTKHVKSNAIIYVKDGSTAGIGAGQMSRIDSARIAARKAIDAQDAAAGATAIIQPGGSIRDDEVIKAADEQGHSVGVHRDAAL